MNEIKCRQKKEVKSNYPRFKLSKKNKQSDYNNYKIEATLPPPPTSNKKS